MDQPRQHTQRPVDVQCLELRWTNQAIGRYCKILHLNVSIASHANRAFQRLYEYDARFQEDRHAVIASSIFLACRYLKRSIRYSTILTLVRVSPESGFTMLLSAEIALCQSKDPSCSGVLRKPEYMLASNAPSMDGKSIGLVDRSRVIVTSDYNERDPPMRVFCWPEVVATSQDVLVSSMKSEHHIANRSDPATQASSGAKNDEKTKDSKDHTASELCSTTLGSSAARSKEDVDWNLIEYEDLAATEDSSEQWNTVVEPAKPTRTWAGAIRQSVFGSTTSKTHKK